ncbi:MAG: ATP-binding protein [Anaerovoracaceae bacterium]|nr:ATP-binding protein [Clostridiales bacterium]
MIERKEYLDQLIESREKNIIKVVTGVRRCGKSTLLQLYINFLKEEGVTDDQIISVNLEDLEYEDLLDYKVLHKYISEHLVKDKYTYVFIDEIQNCKGFEKAVDSLYIKPKVDLYITGSNAYMLSGELATLLSGRYITVEMLPLSFKEYCIFQEGNDKSLGENFNDYLRFGSFPYIAQFEQKEGLITQAITGIYTSILLKDVAKREGITDVALLENIVRFVAVNIGSPISTKRISDYINSAGRRISVNTVDSYLRALTDSYIFYKAERYDVKGKQLLKTLGKYYIVDTGLRNMLLSSAESDIGHLIENIVYLELLRRGFRVNIGKMQESEIDFVASDINGSIYYQVAASVIDKDTLERELAPLKKISNNHPKILLTLDEVGADQNHEGIKQINLLKWLMEK